MLEQFRVAGSTDFDDWRAMARRTAPEIVSLELIEGTSFAVDLAAFRFGNDPDSVVLNSIHQTAETKGTGDPPETVSVVVPTTALIRVRSGPRERPLAPLGTVAAFMPAGGGEGRFSAGHFLDLRTDRRRLASFLELLETNVDISRTLDRAYFDPRVPGLRQVAEHILTLVETLDVESRRLLDMADFRSAHEQILLIRIAHALGAASGQEQSRSVGRNGPALARAVDYIASHADRHLDFSLMARHAGLSLRSLQRLFKKEFDCTIVQFLQRYRLANARDRLERAGDDRTVLQIALSSGFNHASDFARLYTAAYGESPKATLQRGRR